MKTSFKAVKKLYKEEVYDYKHQTYEQREKVKKMAWKKARWKLWFHEENCGKNNEGKENEI